MKGCVDVCIAFKGICILCSMRLSWWLTPEEKATLLKRFSLAMNITHIMLSLKGQRWYRFFSSKYVFFQMFLLVSICASRIEVEVRFDITLIHFYAPRECFPHIYGLVRLKNAMLLTWLKNKWRYGFYFMKGRLFVQNEEKAVVQLQLRAFELQFNLIKSASSCLFHNTHSTNCSIYHNRLQLYFYFFFLFAAESVYREIMEEVHDHSHEH